MKKLIKKRTAKIRRRARVRKVVSGTAVRPRVAVFRSAAHIYAQLIDDQSSKSMGQISSLKLNAKDKKVNIAKAVGKELAEFCKKKNIASVVFDRGGYIYHGRVKALAEGAREAGLKF